MPCGRTPSACSPRVADRSAAQISRRELPGRAARPAAPAARRADRGVRLSPGSSTTSVTKRLATGSPCSMRWPTRCAARGRACRPRSRRSTGLRPWITSAKLQSQPFLDLIEANRMDQRDKQYAHVRRSHPVLPALGRPDRTDRPAPGRRRRRSATSPTPTRFAPRCRCSSTARTSVRTPAWDGSTCRRTIWLMRA